MVPDRRERQIRMYLSVGSVAYVRRAGRGRPSLRKARECLKAHAAGCGCWRGAAGGARAR